MRKLFVVVSVLFFCLPVSAQRVVNTSSKRKPKAYVYPPNVIKLNIMGLMFNTFGIQYERKLDKNFALALGVQYRPQSKFILYQTLGQDPTSYGLSVNEGAIYNSATLGRFDFTPEIKYYFKKKASRGLYLSAFGKYTQAQTKFTFSYGASGSGSYEGRTASGKITETRYGIGFLLGYQVLKQNKLAIDFWFAGPWIGRGKTSLATTMNMTNVNAADQSVASAPLESIYSHAIQWNNKGMYGSSVSFAGGLRMLGISIGYNF